MPKLIVFVRPLGLRLLRNSLLTIAAVKIWVSKDEFRIDDKREWYVKEDPLSLTEGAWNAHKIDLSEFFNKALPPVDVLQQIDTFIDNWRQEKGRAIPGGHNVGFDIGYIRRLEKLASMADRRFDGWINRRLTYHHWDTMAASRLLHLSGHIPVNLTSLSHHCEYFDIPLGEAAHGALADAEATAILTGKLVAMTAGGAPGVKKD